METNGQAEGAKLQEQVKQVVDDVQANALQPMDSQFGRLIYLAALRDYNTGRYHHEGLVCRYDSNAVDEGLRQCHVKTFESLMALPLQDQTRDLLHFFESLDEDHSRMIDAWQRLRSYRVLPPEDCHPVARELFDKNIDVILGVLRETDLWALLHETHRDAHHLP